MADEHKGPHIIDLAAALKADDERWSAERRAKQDPTPSPAADALSEERLAQLGRECRYAISTLDASAGDYDEASETTLALIDAYQQLRAENAGLTKELRWYRAAHLLVACDYAFVGKRDGEDIRLMYLDVHGDPPTPCIVVMCSDTFAWACADGEQAEYEDAEKLLKIAKSDGWIGLARWVQERRRGKGEPCEPISPVREMFGTHEKLKAEVERLRGLLGLAAECLVDHNENEYEDECSFCGLTWRADEPPSGEHNDGCLLGRIHAALAAAKEGKS